MSADDEEERIRVRAYYLWQADGCPEGRDQDFWERARELIATEDDPADRQLNPMTETGGPPEPVEPRRRRKR